MPPSRQYPETRTVRLMRPSEAHDANTWGTTGPAAAGLNMLNRLMSGYRQSPHAPELGLLRDGKDVVRGIFAHSGHARLMAQAVDQYLTGPQQQPFRPPLPITPIELAEVHRRIGVRAHQRSHGFGPDRPAAIARPDRSQSKLKKGGPGSRGGEVIATTTSGRPVYADVGARAAAYHGFTARDHAEAAGAHGRQEGAAHAAHATAHRAAWTSMTSVRVRPQATRNGTRLAASHPQKQDLVKAPYIAMGTPESKAAWRRASRIAANQGHNEPAYTAHIWRALTGRDASIGQKTLKRWARNRKRREQRAEASKKRNKNVHSAQKTEKMTEKSTPAETNHVLAAPSPAPETAMPRATPSALLTLGRLSKSSSGPGSRGGHILSYSAQGTPIYASNHHMNQAALKAHHDGQGTSDPNAAAAHAMRSSHAHYDKADHLAAADAHSNRAGQTPNRQERAESHILAQAHAYASMGMRVRKAGGLATLERLVGRSC